MENTKSSELRAAVGTGTAQLLAETYIKLKQPMLALLDESWAAEITDFTVFSGSVLVKGIVTHTFNYLHPHGKKAQNQENENKRGSEKSEEETDFIKVANGWGELVDISTGIVHFHQQVFQFTGTVAISGLLVGDFLEKKVSVVDVNKMEPEVAEDTGLIIGGTQTFKIDISIVATR